MKCEGHFEERQALKMYFDTLLKQKLDIRVEYIDKEKQITSEINEVLKRIRELDENGREPNDPGVSRDLDSSKMLLPTNTEDITPTRKYNKINDEDLAKAVLQILSSSGGPVLFRNLVKALESDYQMKFSNPYLKIKKVMQQQSNIIEEKRGRDLLYTKIE